MPTLTMANTEIRDPGTQKSPGANRGFYKSIELSIYALVTFPALIALTETQMRFTSPLGSLTRTR